MYPLIHTTRTGRTFPSLLNDFSSIWDDWDRISDLVNSSENVSGAGVDVLEYSDHYELLMDAPGLTREDLELSLEDDTVRIKMTRVGQAPEKAKYLHRGRWSGTAVRAVSVPFASSEGIAAKLENGVLRVVIKKTPEKQIKKIAVN
jgi:HSP20 family protein